MLNEHTTQRIDEALASREDFDPRDCDTDQLYRELFPAEVTLHDFRTRIEQLRSEAERERE